MYRKKSADIILEKRKICESIIFNNRSQSPAKEIRAVFCLRYLLAAIFACSDINWRLNKSNFLPPFCDTKLLRQKLLFPGSLSSCKVLPMLLVQQTSRPPLFSRKKLKIKHLKHTIKFQMHILPSRKGRCRAPTQSPRAIWGPANHAWNQICKHSLSWWRYRLYLFDQGSFEANCISFCGMPAGGPSCLTKYRNPSKPSQLEPVVEQR